jgi:hypothetical protein
MATAIMLQLLLEGKGEFYTPEVPVDERDKVKREVLDPLFEQPNDDEYSN